MAPLTSTHENGSVRAFVAGLAHELRQPLSVVETSAYLLQLILPPEDVRAREHVRRIYENIEHAHRVIAHALETMKSVPVQRERGTVSTESTAESRSRTNAAIAGVTY